MAVPEGVSIHSARMRIVDTSMRGLESMDKDLERAAELVATAGVQLIVYGCTTGSLRKGKDYSQELNQRIEAICGLPSLTTSAAVVQAMQSLDAYRLAVATPYIEELNRCEQAFLEAVGFEVRALQGLGLRSNLEIGRCSPDQVYKLAMKVADQAGDIDALFISCTNLPTFPVLEELKQDLKVPVISSNQATLWAALGLAGIECCVAGLETSSYGKNS